VYVRQEAHAALRLWSRMLIRQCEGTGLEKDLNRYLMLVGSGELKDGLIDGRISGILRTRLLRRHRYSDE
jgi:hypothetical protein